MNDATRPANRPARKTPAPLFTILLAAFAFGASEPPAVADEPHLEFLRGLRARGYHDVALDYLHELSQRSDIDPEVTQVLPYERALTLLNSAQKLTTTKAQRRQLDAAEAAFQQFVQNAADHPLVGEANAQRAAILKSRALVELWEADDPANVQNRKAYQDRARDQILESREILRQAREQHQAALKRFPTPVPEDQREQHQVAEQKYLNDLVEFAESTYWEAQTYDRGSDERNALLQQAIEEFDKIHTPYRTYIVGRLSRLWQGKCYEEMGMLGEALGLYTKDILAHPGVSDSMLTLKAKAQWFRLICLNNDERKDYRVVVQEATDWRNAAGNRALTEAGLGIQFELARAQQFLGNDRTLPENERNNWLSQAMATARQVAKFPGRFKSPSLGMIRTLSASLGRAEQDPRNFRDAFGSGNRFTEESANQLREYERLVAEGETAAAADAQAVLQASASEMTRMFALALRLADESTDPQDVAIARLQLAHGYYMQQKYYESAAAADYTATNLADDHAEIARLAAFIRLAAYQNAYNDQRGEEREFERSQLLAAADDIVVRWPDSSEATDARDAVAKMFVSEGDHAQAAQWWAKVPTTADEYPGSQIKAGQAYWSAYGRQAAKPESEREPPDTLRQWRSAAESHLVTGINAWQSQLPDDAATPGELALGKLSLVQIRNFNGQYTTSEGAPGALELLTQGPHAVLDSVIVPPGESRPADSNDVRSARMAGIAYQQLLRAHIGLRNLDAAAEARAELEAVAAGDESASLTQVYIAFGQELQKELEQLRTSGQTERISDVRAGFEEFLDSISQREQGQTFGSLLWIAETYTSLAEGSQDAPVEAADFFSKASATYDRMAAQAESDSSFLANPEQKTVIALRLADCRKRQGEFPAAEQAILEALKQRPNAPNVQFEAALLYRDWGAAESTVSDRATELLDIAINGSRHESTDDDEGGERIEARAGVWGWNLLARRLQQALMAGRREPLVEQMHVDTRFYQAECHYLMARRQQVDQQIARLNQAKSGVEAYVRIAGSLPPDDFDRFDELYRKICDELGEPAVSLDAVLAKSTSTQTPDRDVADSAPVAEPASSATTPAASTPEKRTNFGLVLALIASVSAACIGLYVWSVMNDRKQKRFKRSGSRATARLKR